MLALCATCIVARVPIPRNRPEVSEKCASCSLSAGSRSTDPQCMLILMRHGVHVGTFGARALCHATFRQRFGARAHSKARLPTIEAIPDEDEARAEQKFVDFCVVRAWVFTDVVLPLTRTFVRVTRIAPFRIFYCRALGADLPRPTSFGLRACSSTSRAEGYCRALASSFRIKS